MCLNDFVLICSILAIITAIRVITSKNPVSSVWNLVLVFGIVTIIIFLMGVEYMGIIVWIIYVGAIAILLLFVLKLLNIKIVELKDNTTRYVPVGLLIGIIISKILKDNLPYGELGDLGAKSEMTIIGSPTNIKIIGTALYSELGIYLIIAGLILLVAMIGAIVLTLGHEGEIKRQDIFTQINPPK